MKSDSLRDKVLNVAKKQYHTEPEQLWPKYPENQVLRHTDNRKWYAIIMSVQKNRLGLDGDKHVDVLDVKIDPVMAGSLLQKEGFLPAYHMNKEKWISILLDGTVSMQVIKSLLDISFELTGKIRKH